MLENAIMNILDIARAIVPNAKHEIIGIVLVKTARADDRCRGRLTYGS